MHQLILSNFARHIKLDAEETERVVEKLQYKTIGKNKILLQAGEICRNIYFVNKGCLRVFNTDAQGEDYNILFCPEDRWAADIASFSGRTASFYSIGALEDTEAFYFSHDTLEQLYIDVPKLERFFRILTQNGFYLYQRRVTSNLSKSAAERYQQFSDEYPGLEQRIAQKHIASYLGITPVFLSMIRGKNA